MDAKNVLIFSDLHHSPSHLDEVKWLLIRVKRLQRMFKFFGLEKWLAKTISDYWREKRDNYVHQALAEIAENGPFDLVISLGDQTHDSGSRGLVSERTKDAARQIKKIIKKLLGKKGEPPTVPAKELENERLVEVPGNHDTGWSDATNLAFITGDWVAGGPSLESLKTFEEIHGPLCGFKKIHGYLFIWLNSECFLIKPSSRVTSEQRTLLEEQKKIQLEFLNKTLAKNDEPVFLLLHDSGALLCSELRAALKVSRESKRLVATLCGHIHARWLYRLYLLFANWQLWWWARKHRVQIIPSIWGVWWLGAGWANLSLDIKPLTLEMYSINRRRFKDIKL